MVIIGNSWDALLSQEWEKEYYQSLRKKLIEEYRRYQVYPDMYDIFNCLKTVPYEKVKVVILGQDPYHGPNQAHGYSFSVKPGVAIPPSLLNIYKELQADLGYKIPEHGYLLSWAESGVLLLNTVLTVRAGSPNSHKELGWTVLTDRIIALLNEREDPIVFLLWGRNARNKKSLITNPQHFIIESTHPSPFSANNGFFGSRPFSKTNAFLEDHGISPIDWQLPDL
jgi:uracil-DNA glycosylase